MKKWIKKLDPKTRDFVCATFFIGEILLALIWVAGIWLLWVLLY